MKIQKIQLQSYDIANLKTFYHNVLDFVIVEESAEKISFQAGKSVLEFLKTTENIANLNYHFAFNIPENQSKEALIWLEKKGIKTLNFDNQIIIPFPNWNAQALYFLDPAGNIVEFIARHDLKNASDIPFSSQSIECISEIGLPVPEIEPFYEKLQQNLEIPLYSRIANLTSFCSAGSPEGLFIIVPLNRAWFPTQIIDGIFPIKIWLEGIGNTILNFENLPYQIFVNH